MAKETPKYSEESWALLYRPSESPHGKQRFVQYFDGSIHTFRTEGDAGRHQLNNCITGRTDVVQVDVTER